jgi:Tol biopolymer transport system component
MRSMQMARPISFLLLAALAPAGCSDLVGEAAVGDPLGPELARLESAVLPQIFAPGIVSTEQEEYRITFTPNGKTAYFGRAEVFFPASRQAWIYETHLVDGQWTTPVVAPFSGQYSDIDPFISPDGRRLYFSSIRPVDGVARQDADTWMVERLPGGGWSEPINLGPVVNSPFDELYASVDATGTIYFGSTRPHAPDQPRKWNIWRSRLVQGVYQPAERLGSGVNHDAPTKWEFNPAISPDGQRLVFTRLDLADPVGTHFGEIYVSTLHRGEWLPAENLGAPVNTPVDEFHPSFSADGRTLFFARRDPLSASAQGDLYSIPVRALGRGMGGAAVGAEAAAATPSRGTSRGFACGWSYGFLLLHDGCLP